MTALRVLSSLLVLSASALALKCLCYEPLRCNSMERVLELEMLNTWDQARRLSSFRLPIIVRDLLQRGDRCLHSCTRNPNLFMIQAANLRLLERYDEAAAHYRAALQLDRRPEIYFNLGLTEIAAGRRDAGIRALVTAGRSGYLTNEIEDSSVRSDVELRLRTEPHAPSW